MKVYYNVFGLRRGFDSSGRELLEWEPLAKEAFNSSQIIENITKA